MKKKLQKTFILIFIVFIAISQIKLRAQTTGTLTDSDDSRTYQTIKIGNQWWMAENLNYYTLEGSWCYNNDTANCTKYGRLYNWETAKRVCPRGWHLPTKAEYDVLVENVEDDVNNAYTQLIDKGASGFNALLGGRLNKSDIFNGLNSDGVYWTSSKDYLEHVWYLNFYSENNNVFFYFSTDNVAVSVRCVKN